MNLRIRDNALYWRYRLQSFAGRMKVPTLDEIRQSGFRRILVVATTAMGDAILCTPLLRSLREADPEFHIGFWTHHAATPLFDHLEGLNVSLAYHGKYRRVQATLERLKRERFDLALVANANDPDVIPLIWESGCHRIIRRPQRHTIFSFMVANPDMLSRSHTSGHAIDRNLEFCDLLQLPRGGVETCLPLVPESKGRMNQILNNITPPFWIIHPGASRSVKQWGAGRFAEIARRLLMERPGSVLITGSRNEMDMATDIVSRLSNTQRVHDLSGRLLIEDLPVLFQRASLLLSGDTGPYHIAMAVGTPSVTLFAPWDAGSSSAINGPRFHRDKHCVVETEQWGDPIDRITIDQVWEVCQKRI